MNDLQKLLAKRGRYPSSGSLMKSLDEGTRTKKPKASCEMEVILVSVRQFNDGSGDCKMSLLIKKGGIEDVMPIGSIITASLGRQLKAESNGLLSFHPGMEMTCEISYVKGTKRTFYDIEKVVKKKMASVSVYGEKCVLLSSTLPLHCKDISQYEILIPLTKDYTDLSSPNLAASLEKKDGFWIDVEKTSYTDEMYGFKRKFKIEYSQWINSGAEDAVGKTIHLNLGANALGCFGITNFTHWEDDKYANKWLFGSEYVVRAYLSKKSKETLSKIESGYPEKMYLLVSDVLTDLVSQVKKLGVKCNASQVETLIKRLPEKSDRSQLAKGNRYSNDPESKIVNVGETTTHEMNTDKWDYYVVSTETESMPPTDSVFDLFAIEK